MWNDISIYRTTSHTRFIQECLAKIQFCNSTIFYILTECSEIKADKKQTIEINNLLIFPPCANLCMNKYTRTWFTQMVH